MPVFNNILAGAAGSGGAADFKIQRSLRFNDNDSAHLTRTPSSDGNRRTWTWSAWVKRSKLGGYQSLFADQVAQGNDGAAVYFNESDNTIIFEQYSSGGIQWKLQTTQVFRDCSAWFHLVVVFNSPASTANERMRIYVNGSEVTDFAVRTNPTQNFDGSLNRARITDIASYGAFDTSYFDGYLADVHFIDGQALAPTDFGEFDATTGVWNPKEYTGGYGAAVNQTRTWSSDATATGHQTTSVSNLFDGIVSTDIAYHWTSTGTGTATLTFSPTLPSGTLVEVWGYRNGNVSNVVKINGTDVSSSIPDSYLDADWSDVSSAASSGISTIEITRGSANPVLAGIRVDGVLLVDSGVTLSSNGFHLDFSDNSSNAALGTDSSGNNNTWTVNNLTTTSFDAVGNSSHVGPGNVTNFKPATYYNLFAIDTNNVTSNPGSGALARFNFSALGLTAPATITFDSYEQGGGGWTTVSSNIYTDAGTVTSSYTSSGNTRSNTVNIPSGATYFEIPGSYNSSVNAYSNGINNLVWGGVSYQHVGPEEVDSLLDSPTNYEADSGNNGGNYATLNPLAKSTNVTLSNGNLDYTAPNTANTYGSALSTIGVSSGKWYAEYVWTSGSTNSHVGVATGDINLETWLGNNAGAYTYFASGIKYNNGTSASYGASYANGDVIGVAFDADNGTLEFYKNGTSQGTAYTGLTNGPYFFGVGMGEAGQTATFNFGQRAFAYSAPSNHKALCTTNLPTPTIADGSDYFDAKLYTGTGSSNAVTGLEFSPDWIWIKDRTTANSHNVSDSVRGTNKSLFTNASNTETSGSPNPFLSSFDSNGFTVGGNPDVNTSGNSYVAWCWEAASSTASNTDGSITSSVRANQTAGFSIVTYSGNSTSGATIGHGLNAAPEFVVVKARNIGTQGWCVYHASLGATKYIQLDTTNAASTYSGTWNDTSPTNSVFTVGNDNIVNTGYNYVAYCFAPVAGFSCFTSFEATGSSDPVFVYCGFRPRWIMKKNVDADKNWYIHDTARSPVNVVDKELMPHSSAAEGTHEAMDILSNGFAMRTSNAQHNASGNTYIVAAFAENPFKTARAR